MADGRRPAALRCAALGLATLALAAAGCGGGGNGHPAAAPSASASTKALPSCGTTKTAATDTPEQRDALFRDFVQWQQRQRARVPPPH